MKRGFYSMQLIGRSRVKAIKRKREEDLDPK
jgi:hypothetical protein